MDGQEVPFLSADGNDSECVLEVSLPHQSTWADRVENGHYCVDSAVVQGVPLGVDEVVDAGEERSQIVHQPQSFGMTPRP